jgi:hypothetical protein
MRNRPLKVRDGMETNSTKLSSRLPVRKLERGGGVSAEGAVGQIRVSSSPCPDQDAAYASDTVERREKRRIQRRG